MSPASGKICGSLLGRWASGERNIPSEAETETGTED